MDWLSLATSKKIQKKLWYKWMLVVTELFDFAVNDFDAMNSARCSRTLVVTELVVSGKQCTLNAGSM